MDLLTIKKYAIDDPLSVIQLGMQYGNDQVFYTGYLETRYENIKQTHGPALSFFQIEPVTHNDVKDWLLSPHGKPFLNRILQYFNFDKLPPDEYLEIDQRYAAIICRLIYFRNKAPMPISKNAVEIANLHKEVYNTKYGKADPILNAKLIQELIDRGI
jgi:hypothetical protein